MHENEKIHANPKRVLGLNILLVDDHALNRFMVQAILEKWNCRITIAEDGLEAIGKTIADPALDLILMDMRMPVMDGKTASDFIRNRLRSTIPIIAITSDTIHYNKSSEGTSGITDFISKPFSQEELYKKSTVVLEKRMPGLPESCMDLSTLRNDGDNNFIARMIDLFLEDTPEKIRLLEKAIKDKNQQVLMDIAHTIKPSLRYLANSSVLESALNIEKHADPLGSLIYAETLLLVSELTKLSEELTQFRESLDV